MNSDVRAVQPGVRHQLGVQTNDVAERRQAALEQLPRHDSDGHGRRGPAPGTGQASRRYAPSSFQTRRKKQARYASQETLRRLADRPAHLSAELPAVVPRQGHSAWLDPSTRKLPRAATSPSSTATTHPSSCTPLRQDREPHEATGQSCSSRCWSSPGSGIADIARAEGRRRAGRSRRAWCAGLVGA